MNNKNEVFEYLIDQLRQQMANNPYKQQCEDLAREAQSLKNQLRDASALVDELLGDNIKKSEHISHLTWRVKELHLALVQATGDVEVYKLIREQEQSGRRKEDVQECAHDWVLDEKGDYFICAKCGKQEAELIDCRHTNTVGLRKGFAPGFTKKCLDCGAKLK